ncbi:MAG: CsbD family protein [Lewinellaceae bacterium]|nr:CsbD family protein [Lewinellaceae bacterium]MCB9287905.1 CsbD family protein [Lewinellaceae bacterium]
MSAITDKIRGNWNMIKGKLKEEYGQLTDDDLAYAKGQEDQLLGRLQEKLGKSKQEVKEMIDSF